MANTKLLAAKAQVAQMEQLVAAAEAKAARTRAEDAQELRSLRERVKALHEDAECAKRGVAGEAKKLEARLAQAEARSAPEDVEALAALRVELEALRVSFDTIGLEHKALGEECEKRQRRLERAARQAEDKDRQIQSLEKQLTVDVGAVKAEGAAELDKATALLELQEGKHAEDLEASRARVSQVQAETSALRGELASAQEQAQAGVAREQRDAVKVREVVRELEAKVSASSEAADAESRRARDARDAAQQHASELRELHGDLEAERAQHASQVAELKHRLQAAASDIAAAGAQTLEAQRRADALGAAVPSMMALQSEEVAAQRALLNLKLLLKSADVTDANTYLEFAKLKERSREQQLQVLVYNVTACESHMATCDSKGTAKQRRTRELRMGRLEDELQNSAAQHNDYLATSKTNRARLNELLPKALLRCTNAKNAVTEATAI